MHISRKIQQRAEQSSARQTVRASKSATAAPPRYEELRSIVESCEQDFVKFYQKGSKEAGVRLRKKMQKLRGFAVEVRNEVRNEAKTQVRNEAKTQVVTQAVKINEPIP